ncbi:MAG TPA: acyl-CoA dehydrogenase family protein [Solirubrobacteraceae bacterium]|jgi:alkylation response protein AidB-like acyl-CoA dehydrogenase
MTDLVAGDVGSDPVRAWSGDGVDALRTEVRDFCESARLEGEFTPRCDAWLASSSPEFSRALARKGWVGMTWPRRYGGHGRSAVERLVVAEELLAAGAPVAAHWIADRQSGPQIHRHGSEALRERFLPAIARGECYFSLGMSEPESGSDLASVRTRARPIDGGWILNGTKVWTSHAHHSHFITVLCRTEDAGDDPHEGLSILVVDLSTPGVTVRPIRLITGEHHFNEVIFEDARVPGEMVLGEPGDGWRLVTAELSLERSGPERFLSTFPLFAALVEVLGPGADDRGATAVGELAAELMALRRLSFEVAASIDAGSDPATQAAIVKDLGTRFEGHVAEVARTLLPARPALDAIAPFDRLLAEAVLSAPGFTLRGGTNEILRGIVARDLGVR